MADHPRVLFYGSPDFAIPTLQALIDSAYRPIAVVTQPDARAGRGRALRPPPVKELAAAHDIPILQPSNLRDPDTIAQISELQPALQIVAAYGKIIPVELLDLPPHGTLNVHASLLPRWRGAAPISAAILHGDQQTGVTIMLVDETEDTGDIVSQRTTGIRTDEHAGQLSDRLAEMGAELLLSTLPDWMAGNVTPTAQDASRATRARRLKKQQGRINWADSAEQIARHVRAYTPWPGATTTLANRSVHVTEASASDCASSGEPGKIVGVGQTINVATENGVLEVARLKRAGGREMGAAEFARGSRDLLGQRFGVRDD